MTIRTWIRGGLLGGAALWALSLGYAHASFSACRTDPTVTLSNGVSIQLWADIQTDISNVSEVDYTLHVPKGVTITSISYDSTGYLEHVALVADQTGTHYALGTDVQTTNAKVGVTANAIRRDGTTAKKSGTSDSTITLNWCT